MNVLLICPEFPDTFWSFKHVLKIIHKKSSSPPLDLLTVAALLPREWAKRLVDLNVTKLTGKDLEWADCVFIGAMAVQRESACQVIDQCKEAGIRVVAGGSLFMGECEQFGGIDHFVLNEAELTLPLFLNDLGHGNAMRIYATSDFADMRKTPVPLWELADIEKYASMSIQFSRGCPHHCEFCNVTALFGHRPRTKTVEQIIAELDSFYRLGWRGPVFFVDDNFIGNKWYLKTELLPSLIRWRKDKSRISFYTEVSINLADDEQLMQMMVDAGFGKVFIGIETPDEDSLTECGKKQNKNRNLIEDVRRIQRAGLEVQGGFIVGFDHDKPSVFQQQIDFIQESGIVTATVGMLQAPPGTRLYERMLREGRILDQMSWNTLIVSGMTNIVPNMNFETLREGYKNILLHIYSPEHYYQRIKTFLREYKTPKVVAQLNFEDILSFFRSIYYLGIVGKERLHYWKLLVWTYFHHPESLPLAIALAIYGYHFRKIIELHIS